MDHMMVEPSRRMIYLARVAALRSPCAKSQRGAIVATADSRTFTVYGSGFNGPPTGFSCDGSEACRRDCGLLCMHAEQRAIIAARLTEIEAADLPEMHLVHVKVVAGEVVPGGPPSCWQCSRLILDVGISSVWLFEKAGELGVWRRYSASNFHRATLHNCALHRTP